MSHFTVAVVTKDKNKLNDILAPYSEELEVAPYIYRTKEQIIKEEKNIKERILKDQQEGKEIVEYLKPYLTANTDEEFYKLGIYDDDLTDEYGNELSTYNPNSKWDWYDIGGRWKNSLLTKINNEDTFENNSFAEHIFNFKDNKKAPDGYKWVNGAKIKDIDFNKMNEGKEEPFYTWALVDEEGWYEQGKMGWWATHNATNDSTNEFINKFYEYIKKEENQDKYLIIVDCHI